MMEQTLCKNQITDRQSILLNRLDSISHLIGNTPTVQINEKGINIFAKLEYTNMTGSLKDRAAYEIVRSAISEGLINEDTTVIESSSGNFAMSLATICKKIGVSFIAVIDPNICAINERILKRLCVVEKVTSRDAEGGFLNCRLEKVGDLCESIRNSFWTNQYRNINNMNAYYKTIGNEICSTFKRLDMAFIAVSTGGTISGLSKRLKEKYPNIRIIAVDVEGSKIFGCPPKKRFIPGIGSSIIPPLVKRAKIDEIMHVSEENSINGCHELLKQHSIFAGGSSGAVYSAIKEYFRAKKDGCRKGVTPNVIFICCDRGFAYYDTIYDEAWVQWFRKQNS